MGYSAGVIVRNEAPVVRIVGGVTLDAIIRPDGTPMVGLLGGNALWAAAGTLAGRGKPIIHGVIGEQYPLGSLAAIEALGIDTASIERYPGPTARVTFSYNADGTREQPANPERVASLPQHVREEFIDTTRNEKVRFATLPSAAAISAQVEQSQWHLGLLPVERFVELVSALEGADYLQADCPARFEMSPQRFEELAPALAALDVFLPSTSDFDVMAPGEDPLAVTRALHAVGTEVVVLKSGEKGAVLSEGGQMWHVPAWPHVADGDPTGAGDVFCGAFACSVLRGEGLLTAVAFASACASFALQTNSPLDLETEAAEQIALRAAVIEEKAKKL